MSSDTHHNSGNSDRQAQGFYNQQNIDIAGNIRDSLRHTDNTVYSPKTPYEQRKPKSPKGSKGLSNQQKKDTNNFPYWLEVTYGLQNCKWMTLTFDKNLPDSNLVNLLKNIGNRKLINDIKYVMDSKAYKSLEIKPYIIVIGIRDRESYNRRMPCFDINILCVFRDKDGKELFNESSIIKEIYRKASNRAEERIDVPVDNYSDIPYNTLENYSQLSQYLANHQAEPKLITYFRQTEYGAYLPNTWVYFPQSVKTELKESEIKSTYEGIKPSDMRQIYQTEFSDEVEILEDSCEYKGTSKLNQNISKEDFVNRCKQAVDSTNPESVTHDEIIAQPTFKVGDWVYWSNATGNLASLNPFRVRAVDGNYAYLDYIACAVAISELKQKNVSY